MFHLLLVLATVVQRIDYQSEEVPYDYSVTTLWLSIYLLSTLLSTLMACPKFYTLPSWAGDSLKKLRDWAEALTSVFSDPIKEGLDNDKEKC